MASNEDDNIVVAKDPQASPITRRHDWSSGTTAKRANFFEREPTEDDIAAHEARMALMNRWIPTRDALGAADLNKPVQTPTSKTEWELRDVMFMIPKLRGKVTMHEWGLALCRNNYDEAAAIKYLFDKMNNSASDPP